MATAGRLVERLLGIDSDHRRVFGLLGNCAWSELILQSGHWRFIRHNSSVLPRPDGLLEGAGRPVDVAHRGADAAPSERGARL